MLFRLYVSSLKPPGHSPCVPATPLDAASFHQGPTDPYRSAPKPAIMVWPYHNFHSTPVLLSILNSTKDLTGNRFECQLALCHLTQSCSPDSPGLFPCWLQGSVVQSFFPSLFLGAALPSSLPSPYSGTVVLNQG